jgi:peptide-methionine (S)-S-oxide reductase
VDDEQRVRAEKSRDELAATGRNRKPIATTIEDPAQFWMAEDYHQQYLEKRGQASCRIAW